jgi:hypothetical protein
MTITLDLPQELEQELSVEAEKISLSLPEYILQLLAIRKFLEGQLRTGAELVSYWQSEGLINCVLRLRIAKNMLTKFAM